MFIMFLGKGGCVKRVISFWYCIYRTVFKGTGDF